MYKHAQQGNPSAQIPSHTSQSTHTHPNAHNRQYESINSLKTYPEVDLFAVEVDDDDGAHALVHLLGVLHSGGLIC